jgi:hypothetical protein
VFIDRVTLEGDICCGTRWYLRGGLDICAILMVVGTNVIKIEVSFRGTDMVVCWEIG